jgi:hypothetical protein
MRGINRHREVCFMLGAIVAHHKGNAQLARALRRDGHTDKAAGFAREEVDNLRSYFLRRNHEIPLVFTVLVIHKNDHLSFANIVQNVRNRI